MTDGRRNGDGTSTEIKVDVAVLQEKYEEQRACLKDIRHVQLPYISTRLNVIENKIAYATGGLATLQLLLSYFLK